MYKNNRDLFTDYYLNNYWGDDESRSGAGSNLDQTYKIRQELPTLFTTMGITRILDIPCGDFYWFREMWVELESSLIKYIGADIVPQIIQDNRQRYVHPKLEFQVMDIVNDRLPAVDLILARDVLGHLSAAEVKLALRNIKRSGSDYLLSTTFPHYEGTEDIRTGDWRPINLAKLWGLPNPMLIIDDGTDEFPDKSLGLWDLRGL